MGTIEGSEGRYVCPLCGHENQRAGRFCARCGYDRNWPLPPPPPPLPWMCSNCSTQNDGTIPACIKCGHRRGDFRTVPKSEVRECPQCGGPHSSDMEGFVCGYCRHNYSQKAMSSVWKCHKCGESNEMHDGTVCKTCGHIYGMYYLWRCLECGELNTEEVCTKCGNRYVGERSCIGLTPAGEL